MRREPLRRGQEAPRRAVLHHVPSTGPHGAPLGPRGGEEVGGGEASGRGSPLGLLRRLDLAPAPQPLAPLHPLSLGPRLGLRALAFPLGRLLLVPLVQARPLLLEPPLARLGRLCSPLGVCLGPSLGLDALELLGRLRLRLLLLGALAVTLDPLIVPPARRSNHRRRCGLGLCLGRIHLGGLLLELQGLLRTPVSQRLGRHAGGSALLLLPVSLLLGRRRGGRRRRLDLTSLRLGAARESGLRLRRSGLRGAGLCLSFGLCPCLRVSTLLISPPRCL